MSDYCRGACFLSSDLKYFFSETTMERPEYIRVHSKYFPPEISKLYNIDHVIVNDGYVYIEINKIMYGPKQALIIAHLKLVKHVDGYGNYPTPFTTGLWSQRTLETKFCL